MTACHVLTRWKGPQYFQATLTKEILLSSPTNKDLKAEWHTCGQLQIKLRSIPDLVSGLWYPDSDLYITPVYHLLFKNVCFLSPNYFHFNLPE